MEFLMNLEQFQHSHLSVHLLVDDEVPALLPVPVAHGLGGGHDVLAHGLGRANQGLKTRQDLQQSSFQIILQD